MARVLSDPLWADLVDDRHNLPRPKLLRLETAVDPHGDSALLRFQFDLMKPLHTVVQGADLPMIARALNDAANSMVNRQRLGAGRAFNFSITAPKPSHTRMSIDASGDWIFVFNFENQPPMAIRQSAEDIQAWLSQLRRLKRRHFH